MYFTISFSLFVKKKEGPTETRTRVTGVKTPCDNRLHYQTKTTCFHEVKKGGDKMIIEFMFSQIIWAPPFFTS